MYEQIIVGVDGRDGGDDAVALAQALGSASTEIVLVSVAVIDPTPSRASNRDWDYEIRREATEALEANRGDDLEVLGEVVDAGSIAAGLHAAAERHSADLIVVGSCRRGAIGRVLAGDDTRATLRGAPCPVAVAPKGFAAEPTLTPVVGVAWNGSDEARDALAVATDVAKDHGWRMRAMEVTGYPTWPVADALQPRVEAEIPAGSEATSIPELEGLESTRATGAVADELRSFAEALGVLVVGSSGRGPVSRIALGSVSESMARDCACALIVVPRAHAEQAAPVR